MTEMEIVIAPAGGQRQADVFTAHWGDILLATSRTPFFDGARKLLEIGAEPTDLLIMRHQGSSTPSLRARIAVAAKLAMLSGLDASRHLCRLLEILRPAMRPLAKTRK